LITLGAAAAFAVVAVAVKVAAESNATDTAAAIFLIRLDMMFSLVIEVFRNRFDDELWVNSEASE
jgi:hypothetical protein